MVPAEPRNPGSIACLAAPTRSLPAGGSSGDGTIPASRGLELVNFEILAGIFAHGDVKILCTAHKVAFAHLNVEHADLEQSVFGLDGKLERTIPGYVKPGPRTVELRRAKRVPLETVREIVAGLRDDPRLEAIRGFRVRYGREDLGDI